jgi:hypothetical protein
LAPVAEEEEAPEVIDMEPLVVPEALEEPEDEAAEVEDAPDEAAQDAVVGTVTPLAWHKLAANLMVSTRVSK